MMRKGTVIPASTKPFAKTDVTGQTLHNSMDPLKDAHIYLFKYNTQHTKDSTCLYK